MITIILFFLVLSILVLIHEFGHFAVAKRVGVMVEEFGLGLPPRIFGIKIGETLYSLNLLPFGGFVKVLGEEEQELTGKKLSPTLMARTFARQKNWHKAAIVSAGVICNFILGWVIISYLFTQGVPTPTDRVRVEEIAAGSPAETAGIQKGDILVSVTVDGKKTTLLTPEDLVSITAKNLDREVEITVRHETQEFTQVLMPRKNPPKDEGSLGVTITNIEIRKYSALQAPFYGLVETGNITYLTARELFRSLFKVLTGNGAGVEVTGPVGIAKLTGDVAAMGINPLLQLIGILSLNLAVINILPFPALDGGRLAFIIYEAVTKRKVNPNIERRLNMAGFAVLLTLIIVITIRDISKLL